MYSRALRAAFAILIAGTSGVIFGAPASAATYIVTGIADTYWGGTDLWHGSGDDVIGDPAKFDISSIDISRVLTGAGFTNDLQVVIHSVYASHPGAEGTGFGSLFFGPSMVVPSGAASNTDTFTGDTDRFSYVFTMPTAPSTATGAGDLYKLKGDGSDVQLSYYPTPSQTTNPPGAIFRNNQAVGYTGSATATLSGTWTINAALNTITFLITNENGLLGTDFLVAWAMTCANDVIMADVRLDVPPPPAPHGGGEVPLPPTMILFLSGLAGLAALRRGGRRRAGAGF
jgi:hypothetical protein